MDQSVRPREQQIYDLIKSGKTRQQVASELNLTFGTVKVHLSHARKKLGECLEVAPVQPGDVFGRLTVMGGIGSASHRGGRHKAMQCLCVCGNSVPVATSCLVSGHTQSCGCLQRERASDARLIHGDSGDGKTVERAAEYAVWSEMRRRCLDNRRKSWADYGGRGITVCERWISSYENFLEDMGRRPSTGHSIERRDTNGNYEPGNCKWATKTEQIRNRRITVWLELNGERKTLSEWVEITGIGYKAIQRRLDRGWDVERALTEPAFVGKNQKFLGLEFHRRKAPVDASK